MAKLRRNPKEKITATMIWCREYEWKAIKLAAMESDLTISDYITDKLIQFEGVPENVVYNKNIPGKRCNIYVEHDKWEIIKQRAKACDQPTGRYVINVLLRDLDVKVPATSFPPQPVTPIDYIKQI